MDQSGRVLVALGLAVVLLSGCAVRTQFQGCVIRCPDRFLRGWLTRITAFAEDLA